MYRNYKQEQNNKKCTTTLNTGLSSPVLCLQQSRHYHHIRDSYSGGACQPGHISLSVPTHAPEPTRSAGRKGLIPHFLWVCMKAPLRTTAAGAAVPAEALLLHHLSYTKKNNQIHLLKPSSIKTTAITIIFMAISTVMSTWTKQPLAVSKDIGCNCNSYHFGACDSHFSKT